jgi:arylsulfatase A-like enzyme
MLWVHYFSAHQWDAIDSVRSVRGLPERYDAALADDDRGVGALMEGLAARGLADRTVVVLLADHGESLGDHGWRTHGSYLYPELVHVPLAISIPGLAPRAVSTPVPTEAMTPTLLELFGGDPSPAGGVDSLVALMADPTRETEGAPRPIVMHDTLQSAIATGDRFLRFTPEDNVTEMFALDRLDADRPDDLVAAEPETARRMVRQLVALATWR